MCLTYFEAEEIFNGLRADMHPALGIKLEQTVFLEEERAYSNELKVLCPGNVYVLWGRELLSR